MVAVRVLAGLAGAAVVLATLGSALRTVVLPRGVPVRLTRVVFIFVRGALRVRAGTAPTYERSDEVMAVYAPLSLLSLLFVWLAAVWAGYGVVLWALSGAGVWRGFVASGSSLLTLGFAAPSGAGMTLVVFTEAAVGLVLLALLITYLPSLYAAFSRREAAVTKLEVRAGAPPTGAEMLWRAWTLQRADLLNEVWRTWENWFVDIEETHTSFPSLVFFRSPQPDHSWVTAAGAVLDGAALYLSAVEGPRDVDAELCIRAGYLALRRIGRYYEVPYPADPSPDEPVTITRAEFDEACARLAAAGAPLRADADRAWRDFAGWRVNYDVVLVSLATLTMAPYAPWSSDRSTAYRGRPRLFALRSAR